jgi:hypothetical protein
MLTFIAKELMGQDVRLVEDIEVDEKFATFLARNNAVQKSLAATRALNVAGNRGPAQIQGLQRALECPKCHYVRAPPQGLHITSGDAVAQRHSCLIADSLSVLKRRQIVQERCPQTLG